MGFRVLKAGMLTTVQDLGRLGLQSQGFAPSGVMDERSFKIANLLLDNPENEAALEISFMGPILEFTSDVFIAITGGDLRPEINGEPVKMYTALAVHAGDVLRFRGIRTGARAYIAFSGYLSVPSVMGSRSTNIRSHIGGFKGRSLKEGDYVAFRIVRTYLPHFLSRTLPLDEFDTNEAELRVILGPQSDLFTAEGIRTFLEKEYLVTSESDRMGYRLDGPVIEAKGQADIISDGIAMGAVQVPAQGKPIIMLADRQTTGGYAKVGVIASVDIPKLVQCKPGDKLHFRRISVEEAQRLYLEEQKEFDRFRKQIHAPCKEVLDCRPTAKRLETLFG